MPIRRERPKIRILIIKHGFKPHILGTKGKWYWDGGFGAIDRDGTLVHLTGSLSVQIRKMVEEGYFGEGAQKAKRDQSEYWRIRDALITWPDKTTIEREDLKEMFPSNATINHAKRLATPAPLVS